MIHVESVVRRLFFRTTTSILREEDDQMLWISEPRGFLALLEDVLRTNVMTSFNIL
jgi:hypothetical protein